MKKISLFVAFIFCQIVLSSAALSQVEAKPTPPQLPCILAGTGVISYGDFAQKRPNCTSIFREPLVGASISKADERHWNLHIESQLKRGIHLTAEVESYDAGRTKLGSETIRIPLNPHEKADRKISVKNRTSAVVVVLNSYNFKMR